jgi:hypothetical protein
MQNIHAEVAGQQLFRGFLTKNERTVEAEA